MANFTVTGEINANRAAAAYQELSKMVEGRNYNLGELVLDKKGKLTKVNHHASGWFANNRITSREENENVRKAVNAAIRQHWAGATDDKKVLLDEISKHLVGDGFKYLPLTRREVCAYLKMMGGYLTSRDQSALEKKAGEIKLELNEELEQCTNEINEVREKIAELTGIQNPSEDVKELNDQLSSLRRNETAIRRDLQDANVKTSALKWLLKGKVSRAYGAEHGKFGYLRLMLDKVDVPKDRLAKNSAAGFAPSQNVLQGSSAVTQNRVIRSQCLKKLLVEDDSQGEDRSEKVRNTVLSAFIRDAHFNIVSGSDKRRLLLGQAHQLLKKDWNISKEDVMGGIRDVVSSVTFDKVHSLMDEMKPLMSSLARYKGEKKFKTENDLFLSLQASIDRALSELEEKMSDLISEFERRLPTPVSKETYEKNSLRLAKDDSSMSVGYEKLLDDMAALVNDFTAKSFGFGTKDGLAGIIATMAEDAVREKRTSRDISASSGNVNVKSMIPEIEKDIAFLRNFTGTSMSVDALNEQLAQFNNTYVKSQRSGSKTDEQLFADFESKRIDDNYLAALSRKMKPLLQSYTSKSKFGSNQAQLAVMLPSEPGDIKNALEMFTIEDLRDKIGLSKNKDFQTFYLRAGIDADQLMEFVDFGFAFLSDDRIATLRDAMRNMSARISKLAASQKREDLVEAGKLLASLKQMRVRMGRVLELTKDIKVPDRTEEGKKFAITEKLSAAVSVFTVKGGSDEEYESVDSEDMSGGARSDSDIALVMQKNATHVEGVKETRVAVNDALVNQLSSLREFCESLSTVFVNPLNGGDTWIDVDALDSKLTDAIENFNQEGFGEPIDLAEEVPVDVQQQKDWNTYSKDLTSMAVQQLSPNALTGGPLKYDPNFISYRQFNIGALKI